MSGVVSADSYQRIQVAVVRGFRFGLRFLRGTTVRWQPEGEMTGGMPESPWQKPLGLREMFTDCDLKG